MKNPPTPKPEASEKGAPAALRVIADQEAEARKDHSAAKAALDNAIADQLLNPEDEIAGKRVENARAHLDDCETRWHKWLKQLHLFDKSVDETKRDTSEAITQEDGKQVFFIGTIAIRQALENTLSRLLPELLECKNEQDMHKKGYTALRDAMLNSFVACISEKLLPPWTKQAVEDAL